jgi:hypothetical protein
MLKRISLFFPCSLLCLCVIRAQYSYVDSTLTQPANKEVVASYFKMMGQNASLYNGVEYVGFDKNIQGSPFFGPGNMQNATIEYEGIVYHDIPVCYDMVNDEVIIKDYLQDHYIQLVKEKISWFNLLEHEFIRLTPDSSLNFLVDAGFYDRIYKGTISVFAKRKKWMGYTTGAEKVTYNFNNKVSYFILKNDGWFKLTGTKSLMASFKSNKKELRDFYRTNHLNFKKDPESTLLKIAYYYDHLKKQAE